MTWIGRKMKKKIICSLLVLLCFACLIAPMLVADAATKDSAKKHFIGKVIDKYEYSCLVEVFDAGNQAFAIGDKIDVTTNVENCINYRIGDYLEITFDGTVAESYPMQIRGTINIEKADISGEQTDESNAGFILLCMIPVIIALLAGIIFSLL